ncbi:hypothetical protein JCM4814A_79080 [Streptomyces phaeofaciens JCM 4814]|uniref:Uncharacterized protein n=1 Tax=Streptomyces phaeofaciens TaxID=68254 RepID=A0A918HT81_9ACTN|nr:hypothetical protein GCM10010226_92520 [Streptomyces phaeofaciens]
MQDPPLHTVVAARGADLVGETVRERPPQVRAEPTACHSSAAMVSLPRTPVLAWLNRRRTADVTAGPTARLLLTFG